MEIDESKRIAQEYKELLRISYQTLRETDKKLIRLAFDTAVKAHDGQLRKSGEPYIFHPIAVAKIVASEIGMDAISIISALLHDVVEDTDVTLEVIEKLFGKTVRKTVDGLTKITAFQFKGSYSSQAENFKKILLSLNDDLRTIVIKIADRLHNMKTMDSMKIHKQTKIASETLYLYAPMAHKLGLYNIKSELEDLSLKYTEPAEYQFILNKIKETKQEQTIYIKNFIGLIEKRLDSTLIKIKGRPKSIYSIYKKMNEKNLSFDNIYDKFAIRIIYKSSKDQEKQIAWNIYATITNKFQPNPLRVRDWITTPKSTGYEALHVTVMDSEGRWVEIQIRSERMNEIAERGYASHYEYKQGKRSNNLFNDWIDRVNEISKNNDGNAVNFIQELKLDLNESEIFVFTPKGDIKILPKNASPLDFAFAIHSEIGLYTKSVKVNQKLVSLDYKLHTGDQVEVLISKTLKVEPYWVNYVKTGKAQSNIRKAINEIKKKAIPKGQEILRRKLHLLKVDMIPKTIENMMLYFKTANENDLFYDVYVKYISNDMLREYVQKIKGSFLTNIKDKVIRSKKNRLANSQTKSYSYDLLVFGENDEKRSFLLSECCNPVSGDDIFGFTNEDKPIEVHRKDCKKAIFMQANYAYRIISAKWIDSSKQKFKTFIELTGIDNLGLVSDITNLISKNTKVNMVSINFVAKGSVFVGKIELEVSNSKELEKLMSGLKKINEIDKVIRK